MTIVTNVIDTSSVTSTDELDETARRVVEEALKSESIPPQYQLRNDWRKVRVNKTSQTSRTVWVTVWNSPIEVMAECYIRREDPAAASGGQTHGTCIVRLVGTRPQETFEFEFEREDFRTVVRPVPEPGH